MAVLPGSLDYLYYNGILDHIPYEAYETGVSFNNGYNQSQMNVAQSMSSMNGMNNTQFMNGMNSTQYMNASQYIDTAKQGNMYNTYTSPDVFVKRNNNGYAQGENYSFAKSAFGYNDGVGTDADFEVNAVGQEGKSFRETLVEGAKSAASGFSNAPTFVKGLIAGGIMVGTLFCLIRGKKKPPVQVKSKSGFWSKLNPKNWFKKKA